MPIKLYAPRLYRTRLESREYGDPHRLIGFGTYPIKDSELTNDNYMRTFNHTSRHYWPRLRNMIASDALDIALKTGGQTKLARYIDTVLINALQIADFQYCRNSAYNFYDNPDRWTRWAQNTIINMAENPDTSLFWFLRNGPRIFRLAGSIAPLKSALALGIIFERADERYYNMYHNYGIQE